MDPTLILQLLVMFGPTAINLISTLVAKIENKQTMTAAEWQALALQLNQTAKDRMLQALASAKIDINSPQGKILLGLAS